MNATVQNARREPKMVSCLGWCGKMFLSRDPVNVRFCPRCRYKREHTYITVAEARGRELRVEE